MISEFEIKLALKKVIDAYGVAHAKRIEQLFRTETSHFKSGNFQITLSPGMQATGELIPYGWSSLAKFWKDHPEYAPAGIHIQNENSSAIAKASGAQKFMTFPSITASMMSVAELIKLRGGNAGAWFNNVPADQQKYNAVLDTIIPRYVNALTKT